MTRKKMHHVGIVLPSEEAAYAYMKQYGLEVDSMGQTPYQAMCIFTKANAEESPIEFLIPSGGPLKEFNAGKGGIHHVCYQVDDMDQAMAELREQGAQLLEDKPKAATGKGDSMYAGVRINFVRPKYSYGVLVELWEKK